MTGNNILNIKQRLINLNKQLKLNKFGALILNASPTLNYLTGLEFHLSERPVLGIFPSEGDMKIFLPELEGAKLSGLSFPHQAFLYGEEPATWAGILSKALDGICATGADPGIDDRNIRMLEMRLLSEVCPDVNYQNAGAAIAALRMIKDEFEITAMRKAAKIAEKAFDKLLGQIGSGMTEKQIASMLTKNLYDAGSNPKLPFTPIVASGPQNSANPHAFPSDRKIQDGDLIVFDWGASYQGYLSDISRTIAVGKLSEEQTKIFEIVKAANQAGREFARPGVTCEQVDAACRNIIVDAGYGEYFIHRTGHGLGMEGHEDPYIRSGNPQVLEPGMTFTIEPGIYIPGMSGVRIEDDVVVTEDGLESLTSYSRELIKI